MSEQHLKGIDESAVSVRQMLQDLLWLPGACYSCLVDQASGEVVADLGTRRSSTAQVVEWAATVALFLNASGMEELADVMITSRRSYHLVRRVAPIGRRPLLVVLVLDRTASNLAAARRELAAPRVVTALAAASDRGIVPVQGAAAEHPAAHARPAPAIVAEPDADAAAPTSRPALVLPTRSASSRVVPPLRRTEGGPAVLRTQWVNDISTMRRLLDGLRGLL